MFVFFFFKQKTAYEMRISDWSSDVCSSDLCLVDALEAQVEGELGRVVVSEAVGPERLLGRDREPGGELVVERLGAVRDREVPERAVVGQLAQVFAAGRPHVYGGCHHALGRRPDERR